MMTRALLVGVLWLWPTIAAAQRHPCDRPEVLTPVQDGTRAALSVCLADPIVTDWLLSLDGVKSLVVLKPGATLNAAGLREYTGTFTFRLGVHQVALLAVRLAATTPVYAVTVKRKGSL